MSNSFSNSSSRLSSMRAGRLGSERGFTLVEIMIVAAIIALLASIALPAFVRARKRSQAVSIQQDLRLIDSAMDQYALEFSRPEYSDIPVAAWKLYLKPNGRLYTTGKDIFGNTYGAQKLGVLPTVPSTSWDDLSEVANASFWAPYARSN